MLRPSVLSAYIRLSKEIIRSNGAGKLHLGLTYQGLMKLREVLQQPSRSFVAQLPPESAKYNTLGTPSPPTEGNGDSQDPCVLYDCIV